MMNINGDLYIDKKVKLSDLCKYSTNEVQIGWYIKKDGTKVPRYRRIFRGVTSTTSNFNNLGVLINTDIIRFDGTLKRISDGGKYPLIGFHSSAGAHTVIYFTSNTLQIYISDKEVLYEFELIIEYIKTTDTVET